MAAYQLHAPQLDRTHRIEDATRSEPMPDALPGFDPWQLSYYDWDQVYSTNEYIGVLGTHSDHIALSPPDRNALFESIRVAIDTVGNGDVTYEYRTLMYRAVRI